MEAAVSGVLSFRDSNRPFQRRDKKMHMTTGADPAAPRSGQGIKHTNTVRHSDHFEVEYLSSTRALTIGLGFMLAHGPVAISRTSERHN